MILRKKLLAIDLKIGTKKILALLILFTLTLFQPVNANSKNWTFTYIDISNGSKFIELALTGLNKVKVININSAKILFALIFKSIASNFFLRIIKWFFNYSCFIFFCKHFYLTISSNLTTINCNHCQSNIFL